MPEYIEINHYEKVFINKNGKKVPFDKHIVKFEYKSVKKKILPADISNKKFPKICLRLYSLAQIYELEKFIEQNNFNPFNAVEFGELVSTSDLYKKNISQILSEVSYFCKKFKIKLKYSTPQTLTERDFSRVYEDSKKICFESMPASIIVNNLEFFHRLICDDMPKSFKIEAGHGLFTDEKSLELNKKIIKNVSAIDFSSIKNTNIIQNFIQKHEKSNFVRRCTVGGSIRIPSKGMCPLNNNLPSVSRLFCNAPCRFDFYSIKIGNDIYPFVTDGFCGVHFFENEIKILDENIENLLNAGINEFIIDLTAIKPCYLASLFSSFLIELIK